MVRGDTRYEGRTGWTFGIGRPAAGARPRDARLVEGPDAGVLDDGWVVAVEAKPAPGQWSGEDAARLAELVSRQYRALLDGTALDLSEAIEGGSAAACELLLAEAKLLPDHMLPMGDVLEQITGRTSVPAAIARASPCAAPAAQPTKSACCCWSGRCCAPERRRWRPGIHPLTLIDNPEAHLHPMTLASIWSVIDRINGQRILATHSGTLLASARLASVRRLTRHAGAGQGVARPGRRADRRRTAALLLSPAQPEGAASFARCWLLVEGETEFWLMSELSRVCGYDFECEGVACVEFAQCGLGALVKVARAFGIEWHLLADGD